MKEQKRALIRPVNNAEYAQLQSKLTNEKRVHVRSVKTYNEVQGADGSGIAKSRDLTNPGWKVTSESTDKQFWFDSLQRSIAKASTVLPFLS